MWNKTKSLILSRILVYSFLIMLIAALACVPIISRWYDAISAGTGFIHGSAFVPVCIMLYICDILALCAVNALRILLNNIAKNEVFCESNTRCLRIISWSCIFAGVTFSVFGIWRFSFFLGAFFAYFLGLIMRVLKNVFEKAVEIKSENDFTI